MVDRVSTQIERSSDRENRPESSVADTEALLAHQSLLETETEDDLSSPSQNGDTGAAVAKTVSKCSRCKQHPVTKFLKSWWKTIVVILPPLIFLWLPLVWKTQESKAMYAIIIIAVYWVTEVVPIAITALLPLILFPVLGVLSANDTARNYLKDSNMLFVGGLMMALAIEKWNLHKRIALLVLMLVGSKPKWLLLGFMCTTAFLSMWISNTATAAMMLPIAQAVLLEIREETELSPNSAVLGETRASSDEVITVSYTKKYETMNERNPEDDRMVLTNGGSITIHEEAVERDSEDKPDTASGVVSIKQKADESLHSSDTNSEALTSAPSADKRFNRLAKCLMLGVAYSANIGGTGTLTGTGPNIVLAGLARDLGVNFGLWFVFATPAMILALAISWLYLSILFCDDSFRWLKRVIFKQQVYHFNSQKAKAVIKKQYKKLGRIRYAEVLVLVMFVILILLWLFRDPRFIPGWGIIFREEGNNIYVSDSTAVLTIVFLLFLIPSEPCCCSWKNVLKAGSSPRLLDWDTIQQKLPWNVIILLGSGFAIAEAAEVSGLSEWIGHKLILFESVPRAAIALCISVIVAGVTEFVSNVATATLFLPILRTLGTSLCIHPLYLMLPATVSASYAFMVPVATPPNAIAFSYGYLKVYNMVFTGIAMNILCVGIVSLALNIVAVPIFGLNHFPTELINGTLCADSGNITAS